MTDKGIAYTFEAGVAPADFDAKGELYSGVHRHGILRVTNLDDTDLVGIATNGVDAELYGEDTIHILPHDWIEVPYAESFSVVASGATTQVEFRGA